MKEAVRLSDYAEHIQEALSKGILLNTNGDKFNAMVIAWGNLGLTWGMPTFVAYVRESRYSKAQIDKTGEFTLSIPLGEPDAVITKVCGSQSGRDIDKVKEAGLTPEPPEVNQTPGVREYPLTLECKVLYAQEQALSGLPDVLREKFYPQGDAHTTYIAQILKAYIIR